MLNAIEVLKANIDKLGASDRKFAKSLLEQSRYRALSPRQRECATSLAQRALNAVTAPASAASAAPVALGNVAEIVALFDKAKEAGKARLSMLLVTSSGVTIRLGMAGANASQPGTINVTTQGSFEDRTFFGRITRDGEFVPHRGAATPDDLLPAIMEMANNPAEVATRYGRKTGACCFCGLKLTDGRSTSVGYGPECADNYGLPWG